MTFSGMTDAEKKAYLTAITEVTVNDEAYTVSSGSISSSDADNTCKRHATNTAYDVSAYDVLQFTLNGLHDGDEVVIKANGYTDLEYTVKFTEEPTVPDDGQIEMTIAGFEKKTETSWGTQNTYYRMSFEAPATGTVSDYLKAITEVTVGEKQYSYSNSYGVSASDSTSYAINSFYGNGSYQYVLDLTEDGFTAEKVTIVIKAEGYKDLTYIAIIDEVYQLKDAPTFEGETDGVINVIEGENLTVNISDTAYLQNAKVTTDPDVKEVQYSWSTCYILFEGISESKLSKYLDKVSVSVQLPLTDVLLPAQTTELPKFDIILPEVTEEVTEDTTDVTEDAEVKENETEEAENADESSEAEKSESEEEEVTETPETEETEAEASEDQVEETEAAEEAETEADAEISVEAEEVTAE